MKKLFFIFCFALFSSASSMLYAQSSMSDQQVLEYVMRESEKGISRDQIATDLMKRGVSIEQIQRIRSKYEREHGTNQVGTVSLTGKDSPRSRLRENNSERKEPLGTNGLERVDVSTSSLNEHDRALLDGQRQTEYVNEMSFLFSDSLSTKKNVPSERKGKVVFGRNIFNRENLNFEPEMNIATPDDYKMGPGDAVFIDVWGASQKSFSSVVSPDGSIDVEGFGPVTLSGLTVAQANRELKSSLGQFFGGSNVKLTVGQTKTISVNVMGEVQVPGTYSLSAFATVFHALYMAGGTNEIGTLRNIKVYRKNKLVTVVDIYDYILHGKLSGNIRLQSGDVIIVGVYDSLVRIDGKVKRPMYYEMKSTESLATLLDYAGGFTGDAFSGSLRVTRKTEGRYSVYTIGEFDRSSFKMHDGDEVFVDPVLNRYTNMVEIRGAVFRPGKYQMDGSITTLKQLIEAAGGLSEYAFEERVIIHRLKENRSLDVLSFNVKALLAHQIPDVALKNEDIIFVPSFEDVLGRQQVKISGEVLYPGTYKFADNTTIEDLILQAGGLTDAASRAKVDVSRRVRNSLSTTADTIVARDFTFSLVDGFVVDGTPGFKLEPFDEVFVRRSPGYNEQEHVSVHGEVAFTGDYVLAHKNQRLSELVKAAGGLTNEAYAKGARLERFLTSDEILKQETMLKMATMGDSLNVKKLDLGKTRYVGINLDMAMSHPGSDEWDIVLQKGDRLTIPQYNNTVSISGEVMYPNTVVYKEGENLKYYVNQSGGYSSQAKSSRVFAVNMNGTVTRVKSSKDIQPGCTIIVPAKNKRKRLSFSEVLGLGTMTATMATVIATLVK